MNMFNAFERNDLLMAMIKPLTGDEVDLEPARKAFESTKGDFRTKLTAALEARLAQMVEPEVFIDLPEHPDQLLKSELEALVRPVADGFLRSHPTKTELLEQVRRIQQRQERRPAWIPRVDLNGNPIAPQVDPTDTEYWSDRPLVVAALPELGHVTVQLPAAGDERPELAMAPGGIGEWESALFTVLGLVGDDAVVEIDAAANEALVPEENRWWVIDPPTPLPAALDPGVASELLATSATLGGLLVADNTADACESILDALEAAGDWRYSPQWVLNTWNPTDDTPIRAVARAAITGWANSERSGMLVYVHGGSLHTDIGLLGQPAPLHSYLLAITRSADNTDTVESVHRMTWSCPNEYWCHRGGCPEVEFPEMRALLTPLVAAAHGVDVAVSENDAPDPYPRLYGEGDGPEYVDTVLELATSVLSEADWVELDQSTWDGGLKEVLLRRGEHCLTVSYDPVTRQIQLIDGKAELELMLQLLSDDGVLTGDETSLTIDTSEAATERWGDDLLIAAHDLLRDRINTLPQLESPVRATVLGLHPHADGTLRAPYSATLAEQ